MITLKYKFIFIFSKNKFFINDKKIKPITVFAQDFTIY
jgi:hypothetical protein